MNDHTQLAERIVTALEGRFRDWLMPGEHQEAKLLVAEILAEGERSRLAPCSERLDAVRRKLCSVGLHPGHHDTAEKAAAAVCEMIAYFRRELANPPHDVQCLVLRRLGVEGYTEQDEPTCKIVSLPNVRNLPRDE